MKVIAWNGGARGTRRRRSFSSVRCCGAGAIIALLCAVAAYGEDAAPLRLMQTFPLPGVEGRIDHLAIDLNGQRLFVAALGNDTVEVIDLQTGTRNHSITGLHEPQGVSFAADMNRLFVANGRSGTVDIFDGTTFKSIGNVTLSDDADNLRYDAVGKRIYVGYGAGALGIIDAQNGKRVGDIKLAGHPESFQIETAGPRIFVNVPDAKHIAVLDRQQSAVIGTWTVPQATANFPLAVDEAHQRLFVGCRKPSTLVVFDSTSGRPVTSLETARDADDVFYDSTRRRIYVSGGEGVLEVIAQQDPDHYVSVARLPTAPGARTSLFVAELARLYLAVPHRGDQRAEIRVFATQP